MKNRILIVLIIMAVMPVFGITIEEFDEIFDFSLTLRDLTEISGIDALSEADSGKFIIISGSVASRAIISSDEQNFIGEIVLVDGTWVGVENVIKYQCIVRFTGLEFSSMIPARRSRRANPDEVVLNSSVLIIGKLAELRTLDNGLIIPVVEGFHLRKSF